MKCPRCVQVIHKGAASCPHCGFSLGEGDELFGSEGPEMTRLDDGAGLMTRVGRERVKRAMGRFEHHFPQLWFAVRTGVPHPGEDDLRQFGFWLMNRATITDLQHGRAREGGLLLTIDPDGRKAGMTWGYRLDGHLNEDDTFLALSRAHSYWMEGRFDDGILRVIEEMTRLLMKRSRKAKHRAARGGAA